MARININDKLWSDPRFDALKILVGNEFVAIGIVVKAFRMAQEYWSNGQQLIPVETWDLYPFSYLEKAGLADRTDSGIYVKGSQDNFEWLSKKRAAARAGGLKSVQVRQEKYGTNKILKLSENEAQHEAPTKHSTKHSTKHCFINNEAATNPPSLSPSLINTYTSNKPSAHKGDSADEKESMADAIVKVWNQTLTGTLPPVSRLTDKRKKFLNAQLKKYPDLDHWQQVCEKVKASDFLTGKTTQWKCGFDWMLNENNRTKILEGNYDNKTQPTQEPERRWLEIPERGDE